MGRKGKEPQGDFASALLVSLLISAVKKTDSTLLPDSIRQPDGFAEATYSSVSKRQLVDHVYSAGGIYPLLQVGNLLKSVCAVPAVSVLLNSATTDVVAQKWIRLEKYYHSSHRVAIDQAENNCWMCERRSESDIPTDGENVLIFGLLAGLLRLFGCEKVEGKIGDMTVSDWSLCELGLFPKGMTNSWSLRWDRVSNQDHSFITNVLDETPDGRAREVAVDDLARMLAQDVGRLWTIEEAARELGRSSRSLQRDVKADGHTFSSVVRQVRNSEASRLLTESSMEISDIGYWCGYADQAHFQREFKRGVNMTPLEYRQITS